MAQIEMPNILGQFLQGQQAGQGERRQKTLSDFLQPALGGDKDALAKIYGADADTGLQVQGLAQKQTAADHEQKLGQLELAAKAWRAADPTMRQQLYPSIAELTESVLPQFAGKIPREYSPQYEANIDKFLSGFAGQEEQFTLSPGSARYDASGRQIVSQPFAPEKQDFTLSPDGTQWLPKPLGRPQQSPQPGSFGISETDNYVRKIMGNVGQLDRNASPEQIADQLLPHLIQQESGGNPNAVSPKGARGLTQIMPATAQNPGFGVTPLRNDSPEENVRFGRDYLIAQLKRYPGRPDLALAAYNAGPGVADRFAQPQASNGGAIPIPGAMPKTKEPSALQERIAAAQAMGASEDDIRRMVIGREGAAAGAKPLPIGAVKELLSVEDAIGASKVVSDIIAKHANRMTKGQLEVYPEDAIGAKFRTAIGRTNANDVNVNEFRADMTRIVNESLRLNSGVQTEGDAQRAVQELMAANDQKTAARAMQRLAQLNQRAVQLQRQKQSLIRKNYGQDAEGNPLGQQAPAQADDDDLLINKWLTP